MRRLLLLVLLTFSTFPLAIAESADQTVLGSVLTVKNPGTAAKRKILVKARETASDNTLIGDPTVDGATVTVAALGTNPSQETYALPAGVSPVTAARMVSGPSAVGVTVIEA